MPPPPNYVYVFESDEFEASNLTWDESEWIGCGCEYRNVPENIAKIGQNTLAIPSQLCSALLPSKDLSILDLIALALTLPIQDEVTPVPPMHLNWSDEDPEELDLVNFASIIVPSLKAITCLSDNFGQAWFDGKGSLKATCISRETRRYPLWINTYFHCIRQACRIADKWCAAMDWLNKASLIKDKTSVEEMVYTYLGTLKCWSGDIHSLGTDLKLKFMADILSDHPLPGGVVDAMLNLLSLQIQNKTSRPHFLIADTLFPDCIEAEAWKKTDELGAAKYLDKYSIWICQNHCDRLIFVFHVPPFHWAACMVNFKQRAIRYGDSLQLPCDCPLFKSLKSWLQDKVSNTDFVVTSDLPCVQQSDNFNCPLISVNTVAHMVFGDKLWSHETSRLKRLEAFHDIMAYPIGEAGEVSLVSNFCMMRVIKAYNWSSLATIPMMPMLHHALQQFKQIRGV